MKVILYDDVPKVGSAGQVKDVADGFARNFLFPKKLAFPAIPSALKRWESESKLREVRLNKSLESAKSVQIQFENLGVVTISAHAGREGHLFGSVTSQMVADAVKAKGIAIDKKNILIETPIKSLGEFTIAVHLHAQITTPLKINVTSIEGIAPAVKPEPAKEEISAQ